MNLEENIKSYIREHALEEDPKECCGVVIIKNTKQSAIKCKNIAENPKKSFSLRPSDYLKASRAGKILAIYHSHPNDNNNFSPYDMSNSKIHNIPFILYCSPKNAFSTFNPQKNKTSWLNDTFKIGKTDCYTVVKQYYKELGVNLEGENELGDDWYRKNPKLIQELFNLNENNPSLPITKLPPTTDLKKHDVIVFQFVKGAGPNHVGVYLGDDTLLHHPRGKCTCVEPLTQTYKKRINCIFRYEKLN